MLKKLMLTLSLLFVLGSSPLTQASTLYNTDFKGFDFFSSRVTVFDSQSHWPQALLVKTGVPYDESKDPTLRRGTENWEESQWSFYVVPALFIGVIALILFFNRK
ncbi:MAG: hypothetical protein HOP23_10715 [Methylococcaceae bacterium]|nr:hypothetical protein [Methylococcaceae bacterium]